MNPYVAIADALPKPRQNHTLSREERLKADLASVLDELREVVTISGEPVHLCATCGVLQARE